MLMGQHGSHTRTHAGASSLNRVAAAATLHCLTGCVIGEVLGMVIGTAFSLHGDHGGAPMGSTRLLVVMGLGTIAVTLAVTVGGALFVASVRV